MNNPDQSSSKVDEPLVELKAQDKGSFKRLLLPDNTVQYIVKDLLSTIL